MSSGREFPTNLSVVSKYLVIPTQQAAIIAEGSTNVG